MLRPRGLYDRFMDGFVRTSAPDLAEIDARLWAAEPDTWASYPPAYASALLDQYKIYVQSADQISSRRALTNTFFLTMNTGVLTTFGVAWRDRSSTGTLWLIFPLLALLAQCVAWFWLLRSYRQLNTAKYAVIGAIEARLPLSLHVRSEWAALGRGRLPSRYLPLTKLEQWVPALFAITYLGAFVATILTTHS